MEEERFTNPNPNPSSQTKLQQQQPPPSIILDRFQAMVRERDNEMSPPPPPLDETEVVTFYDQLLGELSFNSKPVITELTILAGNQKQFAEGIADAICSRISEVPADQKLPSLYLLDSIVKNIGEEYIRPFTTRLPEVFIGAYTSVHPSQYQSMRHLFKTWSQVFPAGVLRKIEDALHFNSSSASGAPHRQQQATDPIRQVPDDSPVASPRPSRIHVNPKYLEAPHQLKSSAMTQSMVSANHKKITTYEAEHLEQHATENGWSTMSPSHNHVADYDRGEVLPTRVGSRVNTHPSAYSQDALLPFPSRRSNLLPPPKPLSPTRIGIRRSRSPPGDLYAERLSTSHIYRNGYRAHNPNPRELIDAYGGDNRKIQRLDDGKEWKRSEEEEFVWEDMSPTFSDRIRREQRERIGLYGNEAGLVGSRVGLDRPDSRPAEERGYVLEPGYRRSWPAQGRSGPIEDRGYVLEERKPLSSFGDTVAYKKYDGSITSHADPLPYRHPSSNHVHDPSKVPPYNGHTVMQLDYGAPHQVRPSHNPAIMNRVMPPPLNATRRSSIDRHESVPAQANSFRPVPPKPDYMGSAADTSIDPNKPSLFVPSVSISTVPAHMPAQQPMVTMRTQGMAAPPSTVGLVPSTVALHQLLRPPFHAGAVGAPLSGNISMMPPLPPGRPPTSAQAGRTALATGPAEVSGAGPAAFSGLLSTLMAQGLIAFNPQQAPSQDALGFDFNVDLSKVRNESAINALYSELPRQCKTCGVRFRHQEEHSTHMDWHVTKNRVARNRKHKPSRKWYVSPKEWLCGAETIGTEALPVVPAAETEQEEEAEVAVPADEDQTVCALCGEPFEDFYSDETEEWMYKGAVYMNGTDGSGAGAGPIVHAKCRSESNS